MGRKVAGDRGEILGITLMSAGIGLLILFGGILPAELGRDPTGLGKLFGTDMLGGQNIPVVQDATGGTSAASATVPYVSHFVDISLAPGADPDRLDELEYKVKMKKGGAFVYSWEVLEIENPNHFYSDFHGHTMQDKGVMTVGDYRKANGSADNGRLIAPFTGIHGWYFQNQSTRPVTVRLRLAGFYELVAPGEEGNEAKLEARPVPM